MASVAIVGAQRPDGGKRKVVYRMANRAKVVVRFKRRRTAGRTLVG